MKMHNSIYCSLIGRLFYFSDFSFHFSSLLKCVFYHPLSSANIKYHLQLTTFIAMVAHFTVSIVEKNQLHYFHFSFQLTCKTQSKHLPFFSFSIYRQASALLTFYSSSIFFFLVLLVQNHHHFLLFCQTIIIRISFFLFLYPMIIFISFFLNLYVIIIILSLYSFCTSSSS